MYEHNDEIVAMTQALEILTSLILSTPNVEESAHREAFRVHERLKHTALTREELIDYLTQATIDYKVMR